MKTQQKDLHLSFYLPLVNELDLNVVYDEKNDYMIFTRQDTKKSMTLPIIFTLTSYIVGLLKGHLGEKRFVQFKKDLLRTLRDDYKNGSLLVKNNATQKMLTDYDIYGFDIIST